MILFLDTVSTLPEFSIIQDNKIIYSQKILSNDNFKLSDNIIPVYLELEKKFSFNLNLKYLITNTGPGSYTALRVGISFLSGLSLAKEINLIGLSCLDIFLYTIDPKQITSSAIFIASSNNRNFLYTYDINLNLFKVQKIDNNFSKLKLEANPLKIIFSNSELRLKQLDFLTNIEYKKINFNEIVNSNIKNILSLPKRDIIEPIYISNNKVLN